MNPEDIQLIRTLFGGTIVGGILTTSLAFSWLYFWFKKQLLEERQRTRLADAVAQEAETKADERPINQYKGIIKILEKRSREQQGEIDELREKAEHNALDNENCEKRSSQLEEKVKVLTEQNFSQQLTIERLTKELEAIKALLSKRDEKNS